MSASATEQPGQRQRWQELKQSLPPLAVVHAGLTQPPEGYDAYKEKPPAVWLLRADGNAGLPAAGAEAMTTPAADADAAEEDGPARKRRRTAAPADDNKGSSDDAESDGSSDEPDTDAAEGMQQVCLQIKCMPTTCAVLLLQKGCRLFLAPAASGGVLAVQRSRVQPQQAHHVRCHAPDCWRGQGHCGQIAAAGAVDDGCSGL